MVITTMTQVNEQAVEVTQPEPPPRYTPEQIAKRERWASILLANASDKTSFRLAERLIRDWFNDEYDERLRKIRAE